MVVVASAPRASGGLEVAETVPFEELVEVRNVYRHPDYRTRRLYNDVAVLELGRRIEYDFDRSCQIPSLQNISS